MSSINERLQTIVDKLFDGNKAKFAKSIEIAPTSISNYLSDKRQSKPSADMLEKIINVVDNLSAEWLLGEQPVVIGDQGGAFFPRVCGCDAVAVEDAIELFQGVFNVHHLRMLHRLDQKDFHSTQPPFTIAQSARCIFCCPPHAMSSNASSVPQRLQIWMSALRLSACC